MTPEELCAYSEEHLSYEAKMFSQCRDALIREPVGVPSLECRNAEAERLLENLLTEGFLLHARNLIEFFYPRDPRDDDVTVQHYAPEWTAPQKAESLESTQKRANKRLAHVTSIRNEPREPDDCLKVSSDLKIVVDEFLKAAEEDLLSPECIQQLRRIGI